MKGRRAIRGMHLKRYGGGDVMTIEEILAGESKHVEFKERRSADRAKYMKTVIAFANGQGGTLVFGVSARDRQVIGISKF